jgi:hypothetical protein
LELDSAKGSNRKDIEDFILFPIGIHAPSSDQWFRRYASPKLKNAAGILHRKDWRDLTILNFDQDSK